VFLFETCEIKFSRLQNLISLVGIKNNQLKHTKSLAVYYKLVIIDCIKSTMMV